MAKKLTRVQRTRRLTPAEAERDRIIRQQVEQEFPPARRSKNATSKGVPLSSLLGALKQARREAGLSLAEMTERTGIEPPNLSKLENSTDANPTIGTLERYASAVGKTIRAVLEDAKPAVNNG